MRYCIVLAVAACLFALRSRAAEAPAILEPNGILPQNTVFKAASATKPLMLVSEKDAAEYFTKEELAKLTKVADFAKQFVLVFAWRGSGGDRLTYTVAESAPEQVTFMLKRGITKDLRPHIHIYVLRTGVGWSAPAAR